MRVRKLGSGPLTTRAGTLNGGEEGDLPPDVVAAYAHKLEILEDLPTPTPVATETPTSDASALDTSDLTIREVLDAVEQGRFTAKAALEAEQNGKNRVTLTARLQETIDAAREAAIAEREAELTTTQDLGPINKNPAGSDPYDGNETRRRIGAKG